MISHWDFVLHFSDDSWHWTSSYVFTGSLYTFFEKLFIEVFGFLVKLIVCFSFFNYRNSLYNLDINLLSGIQFANIFFSSIGCLFTKVIMSFDAYTFLIFIRSSLYNFSSIACAFGVIFKKSYQIKSFTWCSFYSIFSSKSFTVSALIFRSLIHFYKFVYTV